VKHLVVIRHAKPEEQAPDQRDFDRRLTKKGISDSRRLGELLAGRKLQPDAVFTSPAKRAVETAEGICKSADIDGKQVEEIPLLYENDEIEILNMIRGLSDGEDCVYIVGHNPSFSELVRALCGPVIDGMKTGSAAGIEIPVDSWNNIAPGGGTLGFYITT
jgi:phosphohistidine phosphatase